MDVSVAEAQDRLPELIRTAEGGESVIITRDGKPVAQITPPPVTMIDKSPEVMAAVKNRN